METNGQPVLENKETLENAHEDELLVDIVFLKDKEKSKIEDVSEHVTNKDNEINNKGAFVRDEILKITNSKDTNDSKFKKGVSYFLHFYINNYPDLPNDNNVSKHQVLLDEEKSPIWLVGYLDLLSSLNFSTRIFNNNVKGVEVRTIFEVINKKKILELEDVDKFIVEMEKVSPTKKINCLVALNELIKTYNNSDKFELYKKIELILQKLKQNNKYYFVSVYIDILLDEILKLESSIDDKKTKEPNAVLAELDKQERSKTAFVNDNQINFSLKAGLVVAVPNRLHSRVAFDYRPLLNKNKEGKTIKQSLPDLSRISRDYVGVYNDSQRVIRICEYSINQEDSHDVEHEIDVLNLPFFGSQFLKIFLDKYSNIISESNYHSAKRFIILNIINEFGEEAIKDLYKDNKNRNKWESYIDLIINNSDQIKLEGNFTFSDHDQKNILRQKSFKKIVTKYANDFFTSLKELNLVDYNIYVERINLLLLDNCYQEAHGAINKILKDTDYQELSLSLKTIEQILEEVEYDIGGKPFGAEISNDVIGESFTLQQEEEILTKVFHFTNDIKNKINSNKKVLDVLSIDKMVNNLSVVPFDIDKKDVENDLLFKILHEPEVKQIIEIKLGISLSDLTIYEQIKLVDFISHCTTDQLEEISQLSKKEGINKLDMYTLFFATKSKGKYQISEQEVTTFIEQNNVETVNRVSSAFSLSIAQIEKIDQECATRFSANFYDGEKANIIQNTHQRVVKALVQDISLIHSGKQVDTLQLEGGIQKDTALFCAIYSQIFNGEEEFTFEDIRGVGLEHIKAEDISKEDQEEMIEIAKMNWKSEDVLGSHAIENVRESFKSVDMTQFYILKKDSRIVAYMSFSTVLSKKGKPINSKWYGGSLNVDPEYQSSAIGSSMLTLVQEKAKERIIVADATLKDTVGTNYVEKQGFNIVGFKILYNKELISIELDINKNEKLKTKSDEYTQHRFIDIYKKNQAGLPIKNEEFHIEKKSILNSSDVLKMIDDMVQKGYVITRYFIDPEDETKMTRYFVFEKDVD